MTQHFPFREVPNVDKTQVVRGCAAGGDHSRPVGREAQREDNADVRLTETGRKLGIVDDVRWQAYCEKREAVEKETARLKATWAHPAKVAAADAVRVLGQEMEREYTLLDLLRRPNISYQDLMSLSVGDAPLLESAVTEQVEIAAKYQGYIDRQQVEIDDSRAHEETRLPHDIDYLSVHGLSKEVQLKLNQYKPETIGQAKRIQGMTPAAISLLLVHVKRGFAASRIAASQKSA